jgi:hypothetical protein
MSLCQQSRNLHRVSRDLDKRTHRNASSALGSEAVPLPLSPEKA